MIYHIAARTETGPSRERNEDHLVIDRWIKNRGWLGLTLAADDELITRGGVLLAVADGMGGAAGGQLASRIALESLTAALGRTLPPGGSADIVADDLAAAMLQANAAVRKAQADDPRFTAMGTTLSGILLTPSGYWVLHAGDSRVLRVRNGFLRPLTHDDNLAERLIAQGVDAESAAANPEATSLTNWIGAEAMRPFVTAGDVFEPGDQLIICSDGLHGFIDEDAILAAVGDRPDLVIADVETLVDRAIAAGSTDNVSVIIIRIQDTQEPSPEDDHA